VSRDILVSLVRLLSVFWNLHAVTNSWVVSHWGLAADWMA